MDNIGEMFMKMLLPDTKEEYIEQLKQDEQKMDNLMTRATLELLVNNLCYLLSKDNYMTYEDVKSAWNKQVDSAINEALQEIANMVYDGEEE